MQARHVHLANRRRRHRGPIELREHLAGLATTELLHQPGLDVLIRSGRHAILQGLQFPAKSLGQHVGQHADELADLDEQALQFHDGGQDPTRILSMDRLHQFGRSLFAAEAPAHTQPPIGQHHLQGHTIGPQQAAQRPAVHGTATGRLRRVHRRGQRICAWGRDTRSILRFFTRHGLQHISPLLSAHPPIGPP